MFYNARNQTKDLDVALLDTQIQTVREIVADIGSDEGIDLDWLNNAGQGAVSEEIYDDAYSFISLPSVSVKVASEKGLLAMKVHAMRESAHSPDQGE